MKDSQLGKKLLFRLVLITSKLNENLIQGRLTDGVIFHPQFFFPAFNFAENFRPDEVVTGMKMIMKEALKIQFKVTLNNIHVEFHSVVRNKLHIDTDTLVW